MGGIALVQSHICPCCGTVFKQPDWSARVSDGQTVSIWRCAVCGYYSERRDKGFGHEPSVAELAKEFLPNLVME
jgi:rubredoxin